MRLAINPEDRSWQNYANCLGVDPDLFFPERGASTREAKEVCRGCVVQEHCLEYAMANGEKFGIWGGMSIRERRRLRRQRTLAHSAIQPVAEPVPAETPVQAAETAKTVREEAIVLTPDLIADALDTYREVSEVEMPEAVNT